MTPNDQEKIGVYVCHCGTNIAGIVDVKQVAEWAAEKLKHRGVVIAREYKFMCSSPGQELIEKDIKELGLNRVIVAACSLICTRRPSARPAPTPDSTRSCARWSPSASRSHGSIPTRSPPRPRPRP